MSYIITDDKHYKNIAKSLRSKLRTDRKYGPSEMATAIDSIPSSADSTDDIVAGIYFTDPNEYGFPTKIKIYGWGNPIGYTNFPIRFNYNYFKYVTDIEFINCDFKYILDHTFSMLINLKTLKLPENITAIGQYAVEICENLTEITLSNKLSRIESLAFQNCKRLTTINFPKSLVSVNNSFNGCIALQYVTIEDGFNCDKLNLSSSTYYTRETIVSWLLALADRTGLTTYTLAIGDTNLKKLTDSDIKIATNKNWFIK